ncbi:hypothetical protein FRC18_002395 [Serendipita sp. 400]|nr:hypothetical protein FRC18_002395 [Serendipita sp. 400]
MSSPFPNETAISSSIGKRQRENEEQIETQPKKHKKLIGSGKLTEELQGRAEGLKNILDALESQLPQISSEELILTVKQLRRGCDKITTGVIDLKQKFPELSNLQLSNSLGQNNSPPKEETPSTPPLNQFSDERCFDKSPPKEKHSDYSAAIVVSGIENYIQKKIQQYVDDEPNLPLFRLTKDAPEEDREFVDGLKIPLTPKGLDYPSLLLHDLGKTQDSDMNDRVRKLFDGNEGIKFLCNTSGSGKTRLLLEGLWHNWGYYFTASNKFDGIGSLDVRSISNASWIDDLKIPDTAEVVGNNRAVAQRRFRLVLLIRIVAFRIFLNHASKSSTGLTNDHKARWLLLQLAPVVLVGKDIFDDALRMIGGTPSLVSGEAILGELPKLHALLPTESKTFCVLDEAQLPASRHMNYFRSEENPSERRPILREILVTWEAFCPLMIIAGTGVSRGVVTDVVESLIAKTRKGSTDLFTNIGAFDNGSTQLRYLQKYLPSKLLSGKDGEELVDHIEYWLHGRHRFTATYTSCLLVNRFAYPRSVMNWFFHRMSEFEIADEAVEEVEPQIEFGTFDFSKLQNDERMWRQLAVFVFDYIFDGNPRSVGGPDADKLVEYGFARFNSPKLATVDEPLVLLAAFKHFNEKTLWTWSYFLNEAMTQSDDSARGVSFERFIAHLLGTAFKSPVKLSDVFTFQGTNDLRDKEAQLISIRKSRNQHVGLPIDITSSKWPTYRLGRKCKDPNEMLSWAKDPEGTVFCFPPSSMGPDLILFLQVLPEKTFVMVNVQIKQLTQLDMSSSKTKGALDTTNPELFYAPRGPGVKEAKPATARREEINAALDCLVNSKEHIIRTLVAYPAQPNSSAVTKADEGEYPVVTIDLERLVTAKEERETLKSLVQRLQGKMQNSNLNGNHEVLRSGQT